MEIKKQKVITNAAVLSKVEIDKLREWIDNLDSPCNQIFCGGISCEGHKCPIQKLDELFDNFITALKRELDTIEEKQEKAVYEN